MSEHSLDDNLLDIIADLVIESVEMIQEKPDLENLSSLHSNWEVLDKEKLKQKISHVIDILDQRYGYNHKE